MQKRLVDYTGEELANISASEPEQIEDIIDYECACKGVRLATLPKEPVMPDGSDQDRTVYQIGGLQFTTQADALRVLEVCKSSTLVEFGYASAANWSYKIYVPLTKDNYSYPTVEEVHLYSVERWEKVRKDLLEYKAKKEVYDEEKKEYDAAREIRIGFSDALYAKIQEFRNKEQRRERADALFTRYIELADGNHDIAERFMSNAEPQLYKEFIAPTQTPAEETDDQI